MYHMISYDTAEMNLHTHIKFAKVNVWYIILLKNGTRIDLSLSEISDEEVDYGSYASNVDLDIAPDISWSPL